MLSVIFTVTGFFVVFNNKTEVAGKFSKVNINIPINEKIEFNYNKQVKQIANVKISPSNDYSLEWVNSFTGTKLVVKPKTRWQIQTRYEIHVSEVESIFGTKMPNVNYVFSTQTAPKITDITPKNNAKNVKINTGIVLKLDVPNYNLIAPRIYIEPAIPSHFSLSKDKLSYKLTFEKPLSQSTTYKISVFDSNFKIKNKKGKLIFNSIFSTINKLKVVNISPNGSGIMKNSNITITFDEAVKKDTVENRILTSPKIDGKYIWLNEYNLKIIPNNNLILGTTYWVTVKSGAESKVGGILENNFSSSFSTLGNVSAWITPNWGAAEVGRNTPIKIFFNQAVERFSAESKFIINPATGGRFSWNGNTMTYYPSNQAFGTTYSITVGKGIKSVYGLDSAQSFSTSYTTETKTVILNVRFDAQDYPLSCEVASLKMALAAKWINVSESTLMGIVGYNGPMTKTSDNRWGNPYKGFVGSLNGNGTSTGYGVYWSPVAKAGNVYRPSTAFTGGSVTTLTNAIDAGNPIVIWGVYGYGQRIDWRDYSTGQNIFAVKGEHARVVKGYKGTSSNPIGFYLVDPIFGNLYWTKSQLLGDWGWFGNAGVIVY